MEPVMFCMFYVAVMTLFLLREEEGGTENKELMNCKWLGKKSNLGKKVKVYMSSPEADQKLPKQ